MIGAVKRPPSRDEFVSQSTEVFARIMVGELSGAEGLKRLEKFAKDAENMASHLSQGATQEVMGDENKLTEHANYMRSISAHIILLRDGLLPALKIYESQAMRSQAIWTMSYIRSHCQAMEAGIY
jgi:hypothetical protein